MILRAPLPLSVFKSGQADHRCHSGMVCRPDRVETFLQVLILVIATVLITTLISSCCVTITIVHEQQSQVVANYVTDMIHCQLAAGDSA